MKTIYLIRHCEAQGQPPEAQLTEKGREQADQLAEFFSEMKIDRILSSPFQRAVDSVKPLAKQLGIEVELDRRLEERTLSSNNLENWLDALRRTFDDQDLKLEGGESSREAASRIVAVVEEVLLSESRESIIVTHGNLLSLLLRNYNPDFGFDQWQRLSNPDVFMLKHNGNRVSVIRLWEKA
ncbi:phosphoglycerate mutase [Mesobacillus campisalis]|uniref:Phosphoglycerate mutase n=1 Tax=Mesobacillus campisalis TaxID=1408103 RepID=A0A0M2STQ6_9BACI|nr:histidine phosphatase family protein [Mesobacillus campisalis]KKK37091.1 phosphoglycerate mutase [Mesobacillus campisalis]